MTVPTNTIQNVNRVGVREDLSNKIAELFPDDTPFLNAIPTGKCTATKTEWQTDGLVAANPNNAQIQGDDLVSDNRANTARVSIYTQISTKVVGVSSTLEATNKAGRKSEPAPGQRSRIRSIRPLTDAAGATLSIAGANRQGDALTETSYSAAQTNGRYRCRENWNLVRVTLALPAGAHWTSAQGYDLDAVTGGRP